MRKLLMACVVLGLFSVPSAHAQGVRHFRDAIRSRVIKTEILHSVSTRKRAKALRSSEPVIEADKFWQNQGKAYGLVNPLSSLVPVSVETDALGMTHVRYQQRYKGINVLGADVITHIGPDGIVQTADGQLAGWVRPAMKVAVSQEAAVATARAQFLADYGVEGIVDAVVPQMVVAPGFLTNTSDRSSYLTWAVGLSNDTILESHVYHVGTADGVVRYTEARVKSFTRRIQDCTSGAPSGTCSSGYVGNPTYPTYHFGRREGEASWGPNPFYNAYDTDFAYDTVGSLHAYLATKFGRNGANGVGGIGIPAIMGNNTDYNVVRVYYEAVSGPLCTARYVNTLPGIFLCHAWSVMDILSHEYAHAITNARQNMTYSGQSGSLDESYSDVFAAMFEHHQTGVTDWITNTGAPAGWFNLADPSLSVEGPAPDRFYSPHVNCASGGDYDVHDNSTILSHAAYLLSEGTTFAKPFNSCTVRAIGKDKTEQIMYRANTQYYSASETFNGAYLDWIQACNDLIGQFGITTGDCTQVTRALQAAEMNQPGLCSGIPATAPACRDLCTDSDGGLNPNAAGIVFDPLTRATKKDACILANSSIRENYCDGDTAKWAIIKCPNGCNALTGACR